MSRKLSPREWMLLGVLFILVVVAGYIVLFYTPTTNARDAALAETETTRDQMAAAQIRLAEKQRMERELDELFSQNQNPLALADYNNLQPVIVELDTILGSTQDYKLSFATVDDTQSVIRREISVNFTCSSYAMAKAALQRLHDSSYRCMLNDVNISNERNGGSNSSVKVNGSIVYFECQ